MSLLDEIPGPAIPIILSLVRAIAKVISAGGDDKAREEALMEHAEEVKAHLDNLRFPGPP